MDYRNRPTAALNSEKEKRKLTIIIQVMTITVMMTTN